MVDQNGIDNVPVSQHSTKALCFSHCCPSEQDWGGQEAGRGQLACANQRDVPYHTTSCSAIKLQGKLPCIKAAQGLMVASDCFCTAYISLLLGVFFAFFSLCFFPSLNKLSLSQPVRACSSLLPFNSLPHPTGWQLCWFRKGWKWGTRTIWLPAPFIRHPESIRHLFSIADTPALELEV